MKQKWLAVALIGLAALGAFGVAIALGLGSTASTLHLVAGVLLAAPLALRRFPWWAWAALGAVGVSVVIAIALGASGLYLVPSAFLAAIGAAMELAAPGKGK